MLFGTALDVTDIENCNAILAQHSQKFEASEVFIKLSALLPLDSDYMKLTLLAFSTCYA